MPPKKDSPVAATTNGTASTKPPKVERDEHVDKPSQAVYQAEQDKCRAEIDQLQAKLNDIKNKIAHATGSSSPAAGSEAAHRQQLKAELDGLRSQQGEARSTRGRIFDELKKTRDGVQKKIKDLQAQKSKLPYNSADEVDARIKSLEQDVESGRLTLATEKRTLNEISQLKRARKTVEGFEQAQQAIDADKAKADDLSSQLDDPALKAVSERFDAIKLELGEIQKEGDKLYEQRNKLFDERREIMAELDAAHSKRKEGAAKYKEAQDVYWAKVQEERARKAERYRADKKASDDAKRLETATRLRDEAKVPVYGAQIEDCQTIIDFLLGKSTSVPGGSASGSQPLYEPKKIEGIQKLEGRKVEAAAEGEGLVARKKKGDDDVAFFVGGGGKKKSGGTPKASSAPASKKGSAVSTPNPEQQQSAKDQKLNLPFSVLSAILALSIPPPTSPADVPRTVEDLNTKKAWFSANNDRDTKANIEKAEKEIRRLEAKQAGTGASTPSGAQDDAPVEEDAAPGATEPFPTPANGNGAAAAAEGKEGEAAQLPSEPTVVEGEDEPEEVKQLDDELVEVKHDEEEASTA